MAETVKKATKTAAKPRKTASKKAAAVTADPVTENQQSATTHHGSSNGQISQEEVARLAHTYWQERGRKHGHHEEDWYRAEQELRGKAS